MRHAVVCVQQWYKPQHAAVSPRELASSILLSTTLVYLLAVCSSRGGFQNDTCELQQYSSIAFLRQLGHVSTPSEVWNGATRVHRCISFIMSGMIRIS